MGSPKTSRYGLIGLLVGSAYAVTLSCSSSDSTKDIQQVGGEGGADQGGSTSSTSGSDAGGHAGSTAGSAGKGGAAGNGGSGGTSPVQVAGAGGADVTSTGGVGGGVAEGGAGGAEIAGASGAGAGGEAGAAGASCGTMPASRITIAFDAVNAERVTNLAWLDSSNVTTGNLAASGGGPTCGDPVEFFGESYGAPENTSPVLVAGGSRSTSQACGPDITITATAKDCSDAAQTPVTTEYHFYGGAKASQVRVTRTLGFGADTPKYTGTGVRVWQPRVPLATFPNVIYPNAAHTAVTTVAASSCGNDCLTPVGTDWSGRWFADIAANGLAMIVLRDPSMTAPADLTVNNDGYSASNLASFVTLQPQDGWKAPVTEVEYLCFADLTTWPQTDRDAAKLPAFCGP
jgi:hypothetical protein